MNTLLHKEKVKSDFLIYKPYQFRYMEVDQHEMKIITLSCSLIRHVEFP